MDRDIEYLKKYLPEDKLNDGIGKLKLGIPVQYIVGNVDFFGNIIKVDSRVLIPRFETELLVDKTIKYIKNYFSDINSIQYNIQFYLFRKYAICRVYGNVI